jgi:putative hemolysin
MNNKIGIAFGIFALVLIVSLVGCSKETPNDNNTGIANPASVYCEEQGGDSVIRDMDAGGQNGYCQFQNGKMCEEWAFFRGECNATKE